jgi:hypothetical protein
MKKAILFFMLSASGALSQAQTAETLINVPEGRVSIKGDVATFMGKAGYGTSQEKIESRKGDIVKVYWRADGVSRCYNLKSRALVGC